MGAGGEERHGEFERIMMVLGRDYAQANQSNYRKGGLIGLAATALGLADEAHRWLHLLLPPVLDCFTDQDNRVRYYACEARPPTLANPPVPPSATLPRACPVEPPPALRYTGKVAKGSRAVLHARRRCTTWPR